MPTYPLIDQEMLKNLKDKTMNMLREAYDNVSLSCFYLCLAWLYEYMQCRAGLILYKTDYLKDANISFTTLKDEYKAENASKHQLYSIRNLICHGLNVPDNKIIELLSSEKFSMLLKHFGLDVELRIYLFAVFRIIRNQDKILEKCREEFKYCTLNHLGTVRKQVSSKYPLRLVDICTAEILDKNISVTDTTEMHQF